MMNQVAPSQALKHKYSEWIDAWAARHPDEPGNTFSAWDPCKRIDYVFVPTTVKVEQISIVGAVSSREITSPSDYCGLLTTLRIVDGD